MTQSTEPTITRQPTFIILQLPSGDGGHVSAALPGEVEDFLRGGTRTDGHAAAAASHDFALIERLLADVLPAGRATITVEQMAKVVGLGRTGAYEAVKRGDIPSRRVNGRIVVPVPALLRWLGSEPEVSPA